MERNNALVERLIEATAGAAQEIQDLRSDSLTFAHETRRRAELGRAWREVVGEIAEQELHFDERQQIIEELTLKLAADRVKHATRSAYRHLRKAWALRTLDPEMCVFRCLTAEEEAATALIFAVKDREYPKSELLDPHRHLHKVALVPFIRAVNNFLSNMADALPSPILKVATEGPPRIDLTLDVTKLFGCDEPLMATPDEPLNLFMKKETALGEELSTPDMFDEELHAIARGRKLASIHEYLKHQANLRNRILYATEEGVPAVEIKEGVVLEALRKVTLLNILTIMVMQTRQHQLLAVVCLESFLRLVVKLSDRLPEFDAAYLLGFAPHTPRYG